MSEKHIPYSILILEDEVSLAKVVCEYLQHAGYQTTIVNDGADAIEAIEQHKPHLIILDLMLPNKDGLTIFRELRTFSDVPVVMATAKVDEIDRLIGLGLGADDYICKPYSPRELVMRVKNILYRVKPDVSANASVDLKLNEASMEASLNGQQLPLTPLEFALLSHFYNNPNQIFNREQLMATIYNDQRVVSDRTMDSHIKNLRKKLAHIEPEAQTWVQSVYGVGYRWAVGEEE